MPASTLLTDLYQLTMAQGYWKMCNPDKQAVFHLFFRRLPFGGGFAIAAGLEDAIDYLSGLRFTPEELAYLASLPSPGGTPLFDPAFIEYLRTWRFRCDVDAIPEGTAVFGNEPLMRVTGPILDAQIVETALLNILNFQTLIATKAARICLAAQLDTVLEFGLRRAQGVDGALSASRAAYIGGCHATSNVLAGMTYGIPVRGTHAHSWVMSFDSESEAFNAYAEAMPHNAVLLVDTYDTLEGVRHAIDAGHILHKRGYELSGIRLDSGDLAWLSIKARELLDTAGFHRTAIVASNDLDEKLIESLKHQGAAINVWGVGTRLVTGGEQAALGGVYKLGAVQRPDGTWDHKIKLSEQTAKVSTPGIHQVRRFYDNREFLGDAIYDTTIGAPEVLTIIDPLDPMRRKTFPAGTKSVDLLVPIMHDGHCVYESPALSEIRNRTLEQLGRLHSGIKRFSNPHNYPVGLESGLYDFRSSLILEARSKAKASG